MSVRSFIPPSNLGSFPTPGLTHPKLLVANERIVVFPDYDVLISWHDRLLRLLPVLPQSSFIFPSMLLTFLEANRNHLHQDLRNVRGFLADICFDRKHQSGVNVSQIKEPLPTFRVSDLVAGDTTRREGHKNILRQVINNELPGAIKCRGHFFVIIYQSRQAKIELQELLTTCLRRFFVGPVDGTDGTPVH